MKHTQGNWKVFAELNVESDNGRSICSCGVNSSDVVKTFEENKANAKLISVAPNMLNYLIDAANEVEGMEEDRTFFEKKLVRFVNNLKEKLK